MLIEPEKAELELGEVQLNPNLEQILADEQWIDDATGLIPHCLSILKTCRFLTERLTALAMGTTQASGSGLSLIVEVSNSVVKCVLTISHISRAQKESPVELMTWCAVCTHL